MWSLFIGCRHRKLAHPVPETPSSLSLSFSFFSSECAHANTHLHKHTYSRKGCDLNIASDPRKKRMIILGVPNTHKKNHIFHSMKDIVENHKSLHVKQALTGNAKLSQPWIVRGGMGKDFLHGQKKRPTSS